METKELVCVNCPMGCRITVELEADKVISVTGNTCPKGKAYAEQESVRPERILTSTVKILGGTHPVLPVISAREIPLDLCMEAMKQVRSAVVEAPVKEGQIIVEDLCGTGVALIASRSMPKAM